MPFSCPEPSHGQKVIATFRAHKNPIRGFAISPDGKLIAIGSWDEVVKLWDARTGKNVGNLQGHQSSIYALCFHPNGKLPLVVHVPEKRLRLQNRFRANLPGKPAQVFEQPSYLGTSWLRVSPNGKYLAGGGKQARIWDMKTGKILHDFEGENSYYSVGAFSPSGRWFAIGLAGPPDDKTFVSSPDDMSFYKSWRVDVYDTTTWKRVRIFRRGAEFETSLGRNPGNMAFEQGENLLAVVYGDRTVLVWRMNASSDAK